MKLSFPIFFMTFQTQILQIAEAPIGLSPVGIVVIDSLQSDIHDQSHTDIET